MRNKMLVLSIIFKVNHVSPTAIHLILMRFGSIVKILFKAKVDFR